MDVETLLRETLAHHADDAPRAGDDFFDRAVRARSARRRHLAGSVGVAVVVSALVVGLVVVSGQQGTGVTATAAGEGAQVSATGTGAPGEVAPAPSAAEQQVELAGWLGVEDPPPVDVVRLVTPLQRQRLVEGCLVDRGWGEGTVQETTTVDVRTGFLSTGSTAGGFAVPSEEEPRFTLDQYVCMASYPINPAYVQDSGDPYVDSDVVEAAGPGAQLAGYDEPVVVLDETGTPIAGWAEGGDLLAITTLGSRSCPSVPVTWTVDRGALAVTTGPLRPDQTVCDADIGPYTVLLEVPTGLVPGGDLALTVDGRAFTLPAAR